MKITRHALSNIECCREKPSVELLLNIADVLSVNIDDLLEGNIKSIYNNNSIDMNNENQLKFLRTLKLTNTKQKIETLEIIKKYIQDVKK